MDIDNLFLSSLLKNRDGEKFRLAVKKVPTNLISGLEREIYVFIKNYFRESKGEFPSKLAIKSKFPDFVFTEPKDSIEFYITELNSRVQYETLTKFNTAIQNKLFGKDIDGATKELKRLNAELGKLGRNESATLKSGLANRIKKYVENKNNDGKIGWLTNIDAIDKHIGGIVDEYIVVMGATGIGKSFLALMIAKAIWEQAKRPILIVSNEMDTNKVSGRLDSIIAEFSYSLYRKGLLPKKDEAKIKKLSELYKTMPEIYIINGAGKSVDDVEFELMSIEPKPCLLVVDGLYLTDMGAKDEFRNTTEASRSYQRLKSKLGIPLIATTQMTDYNETKYARAIQEDADMVLYLKRSPHEKDKGTMELIFTKIREEDSDLNMEITWDFDSWDFGREVTDEEPVDPSAEKEH